MLYQKYRPKTLKQIQGNNHIRESIKAMAKGERSHAILMAGPAGCGKTTFARVIAAEFGCNLERDYHEINMADFRGIDTVRQLLRNLPLMPSVGDTRFWCIDEAHQMTKEAQTALLKGLEDTPSKSYIVLATTEPGKLIPTIRSRCTLYTVKSLSTPQLRRTVKRVVKAEGADVPDEVVQAIAEGAEGSPRQALVLLESIIGLNRDAMPIAIDRQMQSSTEVIDLCRAIANKACHWKQVANLLKDLDTDPEQTRRAILGYLNACLLGNKSSQEGNRICNAMECFADNFFDTGKAGLTMACWIAKNVAY